ncbi:hypothetical protein FSP39_019143 [Pinctada imbricata]|uniref:Tyr recombinase domain-containing protein n=1 Tax=Pinctada imbricata TaxID=66713 RepID=A0AA88YUC8_PINIB|nr:hypothetical protein FSP39_019143 [Pinctada imbricata]
MTGIFNSRPPIPRYTETWDVDQVLKYILTLPENKDLSLKQLTHKVTMLMALTSACRSSEICKLDMNYMNVERDEVTFTLTELSKTRKASDKPLEMKFPKHEVGKLDVMACIIAYMDKTNNVREQESKFLSSFVKPHKAVKPCTILGWIKNLLTDAGVNTSVFKPHSTRGACTSKENKLGLSVQQIMQKANWKSVSTFQKFYNKPVHGNDLFAEKVLEM